MSSLPSAFPSIDRDTGASGDDRNPAVQLFGRRFFKDQTVVEYLAEMLLIASCTKSISPGSEFDGAVPALDVLRSWRDAPLEYAPPARLALKLFAFLGASKLDTRHPAHRQHYRILLKRIESQTVAHPGTDVREVLQLLENLFLGFQGVGYDRTWCAQTFLPICRGLIGAETVWSPTRAQKKAVADWSDCLNGFSSLFSVSRHLFFCKGGELLYLQLCNALRQRQATATRCLKPFREGLLPEDVDVESLHRRVGTALDRLLHPLAVPLDDLAEFVDKIDGVTRGKTDYDNEDNGERRFARCAWVAEDSLPESLLFCIELCRLCEASLDPIERTELTSVLCSLQVLRSLCTQAARFAEWPESQMASGGALGYVWVLSQPDGQDRMTRDLSRRNVSALGRLLHDAIRAPEIDQNVGKASREAAAKSKSPKDGQRSLYERLYDEADNRYGRKLFVSLAKRLELMTPKRGPGARLVLDDRLLRCLLLVLVPPGSRCTFDSFKSRLHRHFGMVVDGQELSSASEWCGFPPVDSRRGEHEQWLVDMLRAAGFLEELSDACSLVRNPFRPVTPGKPQEEEK